MRLKWGTTLILNTWCSIFKCSSIEGTYLWQIFFGHFPSRKKCFFKTKPPITCHEEDKIQNRIEAEKLLLKLERPVEVGKLNWYKSFTMNRRDKVKSGRFWVQVDGL